MKRATKTIVIISGCVLAAAVVVVIAVHVAARIGQARRGRPPAAYTVGETVLKKRPLERFLYFPGIIEGDPQVKVYPNAPGRFISNSVKEGDDVRAGQVIALIDRAVVGQTYAPEPVRSPIAGEVIALYFLDRGEPVAVANPVAEVADTSRFKVPLSVAREDLAAIKRGMEASIVSPDDANLKLSAVVSAVTPVVDFSTFSGTAVVTANGRGSGFSIGESVIVDVVTGRSPAFVVPLAAVQTDAVSSFVFLNVNGTAKRVTVTQGFSTDGEVEISGDLADGDRVITEGSYKLFDGARVVIAGAPSPAGSPSSPPRAAPNAGRPGNGRNGGAGERAGP